MDGQPDNLASLIRWDELARNAELIRAKHVLFVMDACYGGLMLQRYLSPGSMRFAVDMLTRYSRQVLTGGKADQVVADSGGPRAGHSIFTGHLLDALEGAATKPDGILTANGVMAYVYDRVSKDYHSNQSPHFGYLDGDGDFIFDITPLQQLQTGGETEEDILVEVPATTEPPEWQDQQKNIEDLVKEYLSEERYRIKLNDLIVKELKAVLAQTSDEKFPASGQIGSLDVADRLQRYENAISNFGKIVVLLSRWGESRHKDNLRLVFARLPDVHTSSSGVVVWLSMRWYPLLVLMYLGGMAAIHAENYENLAAIFTVKVRDSRSGQVSKSIILPVFDAMADLASSDIFSCRAMSVIMCPIANIFLSDSNPRWTICSFLERTTSRFLIDLRCFSHS